MGLWDGNLPRYEVKNNEKFQIREQKQELGRYRTGQNLLTVFIDQHRPWNHLHPCLQILINSILIRYIHCCLPLRDVLSCPTKSIVCGERPLLDSFQLLLQKPTYRSKKLLEHAIAGGNWVFRHIKCGCFYYRQTGSKLNCHRIVCICTGRRRSEFLFRP